MSELPPPEERQRILSILSALIAAYGSEQFVAAPLIEPTPEAFPEGFGANVPGVRLTARRLLQYAGLGGMRVGIKVVDASAPMELAPRPPWAPPGASIWLEEIREHECHFMVDREQLGDQAALTGALAREVARAFRAHRRLGGAYRGTAIDEHDDEEDTIDLTAVYLGLGVVTSYGRRRFLVDAVGNMGIAGRNRTERIERATALAPEALAFAIAAQVEARGLDDAGRERIALALQREHTPGFREAHAVLAAPGVLDGFALPPRATWPAPQEPGGPLSAKSAAAVAVETRTNPVFRVAQSRLVSSLLGWAFVGLVAAMVVFMISHTALAMLLFGLGIGVGAVRGNRDRWDECSSCSAGLSDQARSCPKCDGIVAGRIKNRKERLDAEENLLESGWRPDAGSAAED